jgi:methylenetetrahydrofolate reductase (NADPH)
MFIKDLLKRKKFTVSFEVFPPKNDKPLDNIYKTIEELKSLNPDFISVTYGAGGSNRDRTIEIASVVKNQYGIEALAHLTCITSTKNEISNILKDLKGNNIHNILALRGDIPQDFQNKENLEYKYARELIKEIRRKNDFGIGAAAYPEGYNGINSIEEDVKYLKEKVDAGVDFLITQLFFDNKRLYHFKELLYKHNIKVPVITGIMPVTNKNQIDRIVLLSGATVPDALKLIIDKYKDDSEGLKDAGTEYAANQVNDLIRNGVEGIHIYTMNKSEIVAKIIRNMPKI